MRADGKAAYSCALIRTPFPAAQCSEAPTLPPTFLREVEGSDKRYSFSAPHSGSETLFVFESAIDCLSFIELQRMENPLRKPDNYLSLSGVYRLRSGKAAFAAG